MSRYALLFAAAILAAPLSAQDADPSEEDGFRLMEEGARMLFEGLKQQMEPAFDGMKRFADDMRPALRDFSREMGPAMADLLDQVEDWSVYHPPEMLDNGDIVLRRKTPEEMSPEAPEAEAPGQIDL